MPDTESRRPWWRGGMEFVLAVAAIKLVLHLVYNGWYGYHQDELYFIACGEHLAFGYVDHSPLVPWLAKLSLLLFGESLRGIRFFSAVAGSAMILLTGLLARRMGGGAFAQGLAALAMLITPMYLRVHNILAIPAFEPLFWLAGAYLLVRIIQEDNERLWPWVGVVAGLGLMNKHTMLFFGFGLVVAMLLTPLRKHFRSPWLYIGGVIAFVIFLPNVVWQLTHGWPTVEFIRGLNEGTMSRISPVEFLLGQILYLNPFNAPLWIAGLVSLLFTAAGRAYRPLAIMWLTVFITLILISSKIYYLAPAYPAVIAGGAMAFERFSSNRTWFRAACVVVLSLGGALFAPVSLPVMSVPATERYVTAVTFGTIQNAFELTGDLRAQYGWEEITDATAEVYHKLTPDEQKSAVIVGRSYALAGAIDYFGKHEGLPNALSGNMTYWLWAPAGIEPKTVILLGYQKEQIEGLFETVEEAAIAGHSLANPWYQQTPILIGRHPKRALSEVWPQLKDWS